MCQVIPFKATRESHSEEYRIGRQTRLDQDPVSLGGDSQNCFCVNKQNFCRSLVCFFLNSKLFSYPLTNILEGTENIKKKKSECHFKEKGEKLVFNSQRKSAKISKPTLGGHTENLWVPGTSMWLFSARNHPEHFISSSQSEGCCSIFHMRQEQLKKLTNRNKDVIVSFIKHGFMSPHFMSDTVRSTRL